MKIRKAVPMDLFDLAKMADQGVMGLDHDMKNWNADHWIWDWQDLLKTGEGDMVVVELHGQVIGALAWTYVPDQFGPASVYMDEAFWWVHHDHASTRLGTRLLEEFLLIAEDKGLDAEVSISHHASPRSLWLLERYGFRPTTLTLRKDFHNG